MKIFGIFYATRSLLGSSFDLFSVTKKKCFCLYFYIHSERNFVILAYPEVHVVYQVIYIRAVLHIKLLVNMASPGTRVYTITFAT